MTKNKNKILQKLKNFQKSCADLFEKKTESGNSGFFNNIKKFIPKKRSKKILAGFLILTIFSFGAFTAALVWHNINNDSEVAMASEFGSYGTEVYGTSFPYGGGSSDSDELDDYGCGPYGENPYGEGCLTPLTQDQITDGIDGQTFADATGLVCTPNNPAVGSQVTCTGTLPSGIGQPTDGLRLAVEGQTPVVCEFTNQNFTCANMNVGNTPGNRTIDGATGSNPLTETGRVISVGGQELTNDHLQEGGINPGETFADATGLECEDGQPGETVTCTGTLPDGYFEPGDGLQIGTEDGGLYECEFDGQDFTCEITLVDEVGQQPVLVAIGDGDPVDTGTTVTVGGTLIEDSSNPGRPVYSSINITNASGFDLPGRTENSFGNISPSQRIRIEILGLQYTSAPANATCNISLVNNSGNAINNAFASVDGEVGNLTTIQGQIEDTGDGTYRCRAIANIGSDLPIQTNVRARFSF